MKNVFGVDEFYCGTTQYRLYSAEDTFDSVSQQTKVMNECELLVSFTCR